MIANAVRTGSSPAYQSAQPPKYAKGDMESQAVRSNDAGYQDTVDISPEARRLAESPAPESKESQQQRFDNVLKDLRGKYSEQEAMSRFTDFMRSEGYEIEELITDPGKQYYKSDSSHMSATLSNNTNHIFRKFAAMQNPDRAEEIVNAPGAQGIAGKGSFYTYSSIVGTKSDDGSVQAQGSTWSVYNAFDFANYSDTVDEWTSRNTEKLAEESKIDMKQYVESINNDVDDTFSAESVSRKLADMVRGIFEKSGFSLKADQTLSLSFEYGESGTPNRIITKLHSGSDEENAKIQALFDDSVKSDRGILDAFVDEYESVPEYDVNALAADFDNGAQRLEFRQSRYFLLSGKEPSAVVMGSHLHAQSYGYTYQKKVSDSFSPDADSFSVFSRDKNGQELFVGDEISYMKDIFEQANALYQKSHGTLR